MVHRACVKDITVILKDGKELLLNDVGERSLWGGGKRFLSDSCLKMFFEHEQFYFVNRLEFMKRINGKMIKKIYFN